MLPLNLRSAERRRLELRGNPGRESGRFEVIAAGAFAKMLYAARIRVEFSLMVESQKKVRGRPFYSVRLAV